MFGLFTDKKSKLQKKYQSLLKESFELSHTNRKLSDEKAAQAEDVRKQLDALERQQA